MRAGLRSRPLAGVLFAALAVTVVSGCSQLDAVAPVGGSHEAEVRYAGIDVLLDSGVEVLVAPVCESADGAVTCTGQSVSGEVITVASTDAGPTSMTVTVGTDRIYEGSIMDVLESAARAEP